MMPPAPCSYAVTTDASEGTCWEVCAGGLCVRDRNRTVAENLLAARLTTMRRARRRHLALLLLTLALLARDQSNSQHQPSPGPFGDHLRAQLAQE
jgi:hypothetical protein